MIHTELLQVFLLLASAAAAVWILRRSGPRRFAFAPGPGARERGWWLFLRQWFARPVSTAACWPSGRPLGRLMAEAMPAGTRRVIELGAGTGALTRALVEHGIAPRDLLAIEINLSLHRYLQERYPGVRIVRGDARAAHRIAEVAAFAGQERVQAVVSGLGMLSMPQEAQQEILASAFELLPGEGAFVQFTYGPANPIADTVMRRLGLRAQRYGYTLRNLPPASVFVITRAPVTLGAAESRRRPPHIREGT